MKKSNKIIAVIEPDPQLRLSMIKRILVELGFAKTATDAGKLIRQSIHDYNLRDAYFVIAEDVRLNDAPASTQRLFELASRGIAVVVGMRKIPPAFEWCCECYYKDELTGRV